MFVLTRRDHQSRVASFEENEINWKWTEVKELYVLHFRRLVPYPEEKGLVERAR